MNRRRLIAWRSASLVGAIAILSATAALPAEYKITSA